MKTATGNLNRTFVTLVMAGLVQASALAAADRPRPEVGPAGGGPPRTLADPGVRRGFVGRGGGRVLDGQQEELFRDALQQHRPELGRLEAQLRRALTELMKATLADNYDPQAVQTKAGAVAKLQAEMIQLRCEALSAVAPTLRPEQQQELLAGRAGWMLIAEGATDAGGGPGRDGFAPQPGRAERPPEDPLAQSLFLPDLVMRFQAAIGLTAEQRQAIQSDLEKAGPKFEKLQQQMEPERTALAALLKQERVDLEAALARSDKIQDVEREFRRTQLSLLIGIKNRLTPEQQARLQELKQQEGPGDAFGPGPPPVIPEKMDQVQAGIQRWRRDGRDSAPIEQALRKFEPLMQAQRFEDAEKVLDEVLRMLEAKRER